MCMTYFRLVEQFFAFGDEKCILREVELNVFV